MAVDRVDDGALPVEFFAAKDSVQGVFMAVPLKCGLKEADLIDVQGLKMRAMRGPVVLPIDLPNITESIKAKLVLLASNGFQLTVSEFLARGLFDAYQIKLKIN